MSTAGGGSVAAALVRQVIEHPWIVALAALGDRVVGALDRLLSGRPAWISAIVLLLALQSALILTHWPWLDEWQALQIAVQSHDFAALMHNLSYEGHPPLWYMLLRWTSELVPALWTLTAVALVLALATQLLLLFASPFTRAERLLIASSQFVMFEMLTVSRSFTLGTFLIVLALVLWQRRWVWLPIALLPMCDFLYGVVSLVLIALQWRRKSLFWPGVALWLGLALAAAWSVRPAPDIVPAMADKAGFLGLGLFFSNLGLVLVPFQVENFVPTWNGRLPVFLLPFGWLGMLLFAFAQTGRDTWNRAIVFGLMGLMLAMSLALYPLSFRHVLLLAIMLIALAWIDLAKGKAATGLGFRTWLLVASACGLFTAVLNFIGPFDRAHVAVREIERLGLRYERWLALPLDNAQGIPALSGMEFENPTFDCVQSFVLWTSGFRPTDRDEVIEYLEQRVAREGQFYMVTNLKLGFLPAELATQLEVIPRGYNGEDYELYLVGPNAPRKERDMPPCVPGTLPLRALP